MLIALSSAVAACGSSAPPSAVAAATVAPTPVITPDPHLAEPATADQIFNAIRVGKLPLSVNNASAGAPGAPIIKQINAQIANWPLIITEYRSSQVLRDALKWDPTAGPKQGDPPYSWVGMNILIAFGPVTGKPTTPDADRQAQAQALIALVDPLVWPHRAEVDGPRPDEDPAAGHAIRSCRLGRAREHRPVTSPRPRPSGRSGDEVSDLDKRIIEHLQQDGRRPFTQIAADLGVSEAAVRARTNRLIERGILQVVGVTDPLKLGFQQMAMIGIRCEADRLMSVAEQVGEMPGGRLRRHHGRLVRPPHRDRLRGQRRPPPIS